VAEKDLEMKSRKIRSKSQKNSAAEGVDPEIRG
jgi:hypothetical protein